ncbi:DUF1109 domain-containing protein [Paraburkholderia sp. CNPSo 3274]|uniref:DUF1109 domain-containing protein n=1 Tax=Paraburkholderia sp. CNPSo 3274 TaxID=2940932 RepID=UPI0020B6C933|nr:DUF1109 domain-containing protein [Paraburkholderia sp. CNPSo 3274]MCP3712971.1 DUF1109 domain-containing protein [Paraburkholderia sp. CNPSo 3274]
MKTDDLINLLAAGDARVDRKAVLRRFARALALGFAGSVVLMSVVFGVRHDLMSVMHTPIFWAKVAFPLCVAAAAALAVSRLGRPGRRGGYAWALVALPFVAVLAGAWLALGDAAPAQRMSLVLGLTWRTCPFNIVLLSVPTFAAVFWAVRGLAPTRLRAAGAAAGLFASALATIAYCLHCPEMNPAFWSVWYVIGMLLPACIGTWLGPRLLRW